MTFPMILRRFPVAMAAVLLTFFAMPGALRAQKASPEKSIIRVNSTLQDYSFLRPWEKGAPTPRRGLGALLEGKRVLVTGVLNTDSIAFSIARCAQEQGAEVVLSSFGRIMSLTQRSARRPWEAVAIRVPPRPPARTTISAKRWPR